MFIHVYNDNASHIISSCKESELWFIWMCMNCWSVKQLLMTSTCQLSYSICLVVINCNMRLSHDVLPWQAAIAASTSAAASIEATAIVLVLMKLQNSKILNENDSQKPMQCDTSINNPIFPTSIYTGIRDSCNSDPSASAWFPLTQMQQKHLHREALQMLSI